MRLALTTLAVSVPMALGLLWFDARLRHAAAEEALAGFTRAHMQADGRARCEAAPETWGGRPLPPPERPAGGGPPLRGPGGPRGRPPVLFAYDAALRSRNPEAPAVPGALTDGLAGREVVARPWAWRSPSVEVLVRMPWSEGPCAWILARGTTEPGWMGSILPPTRIWLAPVIVVFAAVLLAIGPAVRRIRRLTEAVRRSAEAGYTGGVPVDGRDEIAELAAAFDAAGREVRVQLAEKDRREQALRRFLADTTHDVMIPLTVLQGHLAAMQEASAGGLPVERAQVVAAMREAHYLAALVHNLAATAKLDADAPRLHRGAVDLSALVDRVIGRHRPIARQLQVSLESATPEAPLQAEADVTLLEQAVSNVVYNAIRHNRAGGHVAVILEAHAPGRFRLRVVDDGPGIAPEQLARIGERGLRGDEARTRAPDGLGLGLHITRRVAELHGLDLTFAPGESGGLQVDLEGAQLAG